MIANLVTINIILFSVGLIVLSLLIELLDTFLH